MGDHDARNAHYDADLNLYAYVSGQALKDTDPLGLKGGDNPVKNPDGSPGSFDQDDGCLIGVECKVEKQSEPIDKKFDGKQRQGGSQPTKQPKTPARAVPEPAKEPPLATDYITSKDHGEHDCSGGGNICLPEMVIRPSPSRVGGEAKPRQVDIISSAGKPVAPSAESAGGGASRRVTVRRFMSRPELKQLRKSGVKFDPARGNGIPTTATTFTPKNQSVARGRTGAPNAEYQVDLDVTGVPQGPPKTTKSGLPEYTIQGDLTPDMVLKVRKVPK